MFTQNLHAHGQFDDGKSTLEEMLLASRAAGLTSIGLSIHCPLPYESVWACPRENFGAYMRAVRGLQEKYAGTMEVFLGVEWDVIAQDVDLSAFDYAIGSVHHLPLPGRMPADYPSVDESADATARCLQECFAGDADAYAQAYFAEVKKVAAQEKAQIAGHFDLLTKFDEQRRFFTPASGAYMNAALDAMQALVKAGKIFEVNTGAISRGYRKDPYPSRELLCALHEMGGKVTISADTHHVSSVACAFDLAERAIRSCGFKEIWRLTREGGKPEFLPEKL